MGSRDGLRNEQPVHRVVIPYGFWMGQTPVTQRQFAMFRPEHNSEFAGQPDHPVEKVTWHDSVAFCQWLNSHPAVQLPPNYIADLPTEAHWEYACRAGTTTDYYSGDGEAALRQVGWFDEEWGIGSTHPVAQLPHNNFDLFDMHGNVFEWCRDHWDSNAYRRRWDGITPDEACRVAELYGDAEYRVQRGVSWSLSAGRCRAAYRNWSWAGGSLRNFGLRACLVPSPIKPDSQ